VKSTEFSSFRLNGAKAIRNEVSGDFRDESIEFFNTYVEGKSHFHQVRCWAPGENRGVTFPRMRKVVGTFRELTD
jgi:hypothetical protein